MQQKPGKQSGKVRSLDHVLPYQLSIKTKNHKKRGEIPETFTILVSFIDTFKFFLKVIQ